MEIKPHYFVSIPAFAVLDLDLTSTEVIVYSTIYGYSHGDKDQWCCVSQSVLATWARTTERSVRRILDRLIEKGLIIKEVRNGEKGTYCAYKVFEEPITGEDIGSTGGEDTESTPPGHSVRPPEDTASAPTSNNIYNNINNNIKENIKRKNEVFKKPTLEEITAYIQERKSPIDPETFYAYYESVGWIVGKKHMKNWKMAIITWEKKREALRKENSKTERTYGSDKPEGFDFFDF